MARQKLEKERAESGVRRLTRGKRLRAENAEGARRPPVIDDVYLEGTLMAQPLQGQACPPAGLRVGPASGAKEEWPKAIGHGSAYGSPVKNPPETPSPGTPRSTANEYSRYEIH